MRTQVLHMLTLAAVSTVGIASSARADYSQGFETDTSGWNSGAGFGTITRTASGTGGITSASGSWHAVITGEPTGPYTYSGTNSSTPWTGLVSSSIDVYIDTAQGTIGDGWAWDDGLYDSSNVWLEGSGFGAEKTGASAWSIAPDGDGAAYPGAGGLEITATGWYRLVSTWGDDAGNLTRNNYIYDSSNVLVYSDEQTTGHLTSIASGKHYGWFANIGVESLAIDNATAVPEPSGVALIGLAGAVLLRRNRRNA